MAMMHSARAWGLVAAACGVLACNPDTSGLGSETAEPVEPSSSGTSTGAAATMSTAGSTSSTSEPVDGTSTTAAPGDGTTTSTTDGTTTSSESTADTSTPVIMVQRCAMPDLEIPEAPADGVESMIDVPEDGTIVELRVVVQAVHSWVGDLTFELRKDGGAVMVIDRPGDGDFGCNGDDINVVLRDDAADTIDATCTEDGAGLPPALFGDVQPDEPLGDTFNGRPTMGSWQLLVTDNATLNDGRLDTWCLQIFYEE